MKKFRKFTPVLFTFILLLLLKGCSPNPPSLPAGTANLKLFTSQEGIYQITARDLGWDELPATLTLTLRGEPQPFWIDEKSALPTLSFYAPKVNDPYTTQNVFLLTSGDGKQSRPTESYQAAVSSPRASYTAYARLEENATYQPLALESPWLGQRLVAPQTLTIPLTLDKIAPGPGTLRVRLWGNTQSPANPDNHVHLTLNGESIADQTWDGQTAHTFTAPIPENILTTGENSLEITAPGDTEAPVDILYLDWVELTYQRDSRAGDGALVFEGDDTPLRLAGFSTPPVIFDVTTPGASQRLTPAEPDQSPTFAGEPGHRYLAVGPEGTLSPTQISPLALSPDLTSPTQGADYLAIGPAALLSPLEPLIAHRQDQGLSTLVIPIEAIYDQFGHGYPRPLVIRSFLQYAVENWQTPPRYVLLFGDATYDPKSYQHAEGHFLPTLPVETLHGGLTGSDVPLAQLDDADDDPWPDLALGRVPARSPEQVQIFVEKTLAYENAPPAESWGKRVLAIADGQESSFKSEAQTFLDNFPPPYQTTLLAPKAGATEPAGQIQAAIEEGVFLTGYFGHGSLKMWGKDRLFTIENAAELNNAERLPIILNFTCLTGLFTHPTVESLAETLLWNPQGGAVAVLAPSSLTLPTSQSYLSEALAQGLLSDQHHRLGDVVLESWRQVPVDDQNSRDVMNTFMLFGDPALVIEF